MITKEKRKKAEEEKNEKAITKQYLNGELPLSCSLSKCTDRNITTCLHVAYNFHQIYQVSFFLYSKKELLFPRRQICLMSLSLPEHSTIQGD